MFMKSLTKFSLALIAVALLAKALSLILKIVEMAALDQVPMQPLARISARLWCPSLMVGQDLKDGL